MHGDRFTAFHGGISIHVSTDDTIFDMSIGNTPETELRVSLDEATEQVRRFLPFVRLASVHLQSFLSTRASQFAIEKDVERLSSRGLHSETVVLCMMFINSAPKFDSALSKVSSDGSKRERERDTRVIEECLELASRLDGIYREIEGSEIFQPLLSASVIIMPDQLALSLKIYGVLLNAIHLFRGILGANSAQEMSKYALAAVVKRVTGEFRDREVSAITGAALERDDYDETTHRVWRIRHLERLEEETASNLPTYLHALNNLLSSRP
jgi:hypothetical protein